MSTSFEDSQAPVVPVEEGAADLDDNQLLAIEASQEPDIDQDFDDFDEEERQNHRGTLRTLGYVAGIVGAGLVVGTAAAQSSAVLHATKTVEQKIGNVPHLLDNTKRLDVARYGQDIFSFAERNAAYPLGAAVLGLGALAATEQGRKKAQIAWRGLAPTDIDFRRRLTAGMMLPMAGMISIGAAIGIDEGLVNTSTNGINSLSQGALAAANMPGGQVRWSLEPGTLHFMDQSQALDHNQAAKLLTTERVDRLQSLTSPISVPFNRDLLTIPTTYNPKQQGMTITLAANNIQTARVLPEVEPGATAETVDGHPILKPGEMITDDHEGFKVGDKVELRNHEFTVVGLTAQKESIVNRLVAYTGSPTEKNPDEFYGLVSVVNSPQDLDKMLADLGITVENQDTKTFIENNRNAWEHNGTPLLVIMIGDTVLFAGIAYQLFRRNEKQRESHTIATMRSIGFTKGDIHQMNAARVGMETAKGVIPAAIATDVLLRFVSGNQTGFDSHLTPGMLAASVLAVGATQAAGLLKGSFKKEKSLAEQMKDK